MCEATSGNNPIFKLSSPNIDFEQNIIKSFANLIIFYHLHNQCSQASHIATSITYFLPIVLTTTALGISYLPTTIYFWREKMVCRN